jgi:hypothetical protein
MADVGLLARRRWTVQQVLRVARHDVDAEDHALGEQRATEAGGQADERDSRPAGTTANRMIASSSAPISQTKPIHGPAGMR